MPTDEKRFAPAADRNRDPLELVLRRVLPRSGTVLELASGTGQHAFHFARAFPHLIWQPSDIDPECLASIRAWRQESGLSNLCEPLFVDATLAWPVAIVDAVVCINLVHIAPWSVTECLLARAQDALPEGGLLFFYGPFFEPQVQTAPSNLEFDASLRSRNASWGLRRLDVLKTTAESAGFFFQDRFVMPSHNLSVVFRKARPIRPIPQ